MTIRPITKQELPSLIILMKEFSIFDGSEGLFDIDQEGLLQVLFSSKPNMYCLCIEEEGSLVGFLNYYFTFSSFELRRCLWVEDVYIQDDHRGKGFGRLIFAKVMKIAQENDCARLEWLVRKDNKSGIDFYDRLGADVDEETIYVKWKLN